MEPVKEPQVEPPPVPPEAARCAVHTETLSASTCPRCGRFCCVRCIPKPGEKALCPACERTTRVQQNPEDLKRISREVKASFFFAALVAAGFGVGLPLVVAGENLDAVLLVPGGCLTFMLTMCAVVFAFTELRFIAWFAIVLEAIVALLVFTLAQGKCLSWPIIAFPIVTVMRLRRWNELKAEAAQLAT